jgi:hypothetical protein
VDQPVVTGRWAHHQGPQCNVHGVHAVATVPPRARAALALTP